MLVTGCWLLVAGCWLLVAGCWLLVTGCWLLVAGCWLLVAGYWLLVAGCWLLVAGCWLLAEGTDRGTSVSVAGCWLLRRFYYFIDKVMKQMKASQIKIWGDRTTVESNPYSDYSYIVGLIFVHVFLIAPSFKLLVQQIALLRHRVTAYLQQEIAESPSGVALMTATP